MPEGGGDILVGAKIVGGKVDTSKAMKPTNQKELRAGIEKLKAKKTKERSDKLKRPSDVLPGTARAVWHDLGNAIFLNEEKNRATPNARTEGLIKKLKLERGVLDYMISQEHQDMQKDTGQSNSDISKAIRNRPITDSLPTLDGLIDRWEKHSEEFPDGSVMINHKPAPVKEVISATHDVQRRLIDESPRYQQKDRQSSSQQ